MSENLKSSICALLGTCSVIAVCLPATALAQDVEEIVVTGSRIRGIERQDLRLSAWTAKI